MGEKKKVIIMKRRGSQRKKKKKKRKKVSCEGDHWYQLLEVNDRRGVVEGTQDHIHDRSIIGRKNVLWFVVSCGQRSYLVTCSSIPCVLASPLR